MPFYPTPAPGGADDFVEAARMGRLVDVQRCLKEGADVNAADRFGWVGSLFFSTSPWFRGLWLNLGCVWHARREGSGAPCSLPPRFQED